MRDIFDKEFVKEMDDFFDYIDGGDTLLYIGVGNS